MKLTTLNPKALVSLLFTSLALSSQAAVTSIVFNTYGSQQGTQGNTNPSDEPPNNDGLVLPGQVGPWEGLIIGSGQTASLRDNSPTITLDSGATFTLNPTGQDLIRTFYPSGEVDLRGAVVFVSTFNDDTTLLSWELTGLTGSTYDIILFGQEGNGSPANPGDFSITGHDAGNGIGNPVTLDAENDANFTNVIPTNGTISGVLELQPGAQFGAWSGLQFAAVPEPSSALLVSLSGMLLLRRKR